MTDDVMVLLFRKVQTNLNIKQKHIFSLAGKLKHLARNHALGVTLTCYREFRRHLFGIEVGCFVQKSFDLSIENHPLRRLYIELKRTASEVRQFVAGKVAIDNQRNILLIHRKKDQHGNSLYDGINVYIFQ
jgi:hypothetical protein